jgi:hypothetical protein
MAWTDILTELIKRLIISVVIALKNVNCCTSSCCDTEISIVADNVVTTPPFSPNYTPPGTPIDIRRHSI